MKKVRKFICKLLYYLLNKFEMSTAITERKANVIKLALGELFSIDNNALIFARSVTIREETQIVRTVFEITFSVGELTIALENRNQILHTEFVSTTIKDLSSLYVILNHFYSNLSDYRSKILTNLS